MATVIIGTIVLMAIVGAGYYLYNEKQNGACGSGCSGCPSARNCHK